MYFTNRFIIGVTYYSQFTIFYFRASTKTNHEQKLKLSKTYIILAQKSTEMTSQSTWSGAQQFTAVILN